MLGTFLRARESGREADKKRFLSGAPVFAFFHCSGSFNILIAISTMLRQNRSSVDRSVFKTQISHALLSCPCRDMIRKLKLKFQSDYVTAAKSSNLI